MIQSLRKLIRRIRPARGRHRRPQWGCVYCNHPVPLTGEQTHEKWCLRYER